MIGLPRELKLGRCPHCGIANPFLAGHPETTSESSKGKKQYWKVYVCSTCGKGVLAGTDEGGFVNGRINEMYPRVADVDSAIPRKAGEYLKQAMESLHAPSGAILLCASCVDAMLKAKEVKDGSLYDRIDRAAKMHLITAEMAAWAHEV